MPESSSPPRSTLACLLLAALAFPALAQEAAVIEVEVTSISGNLVFIDQGREAGLQKGDRVVLQPEGGEPVELTVAAVSRSSSRCEPIGALPARVAIGVPGQAWVQKTEPAPSVAVPSDSPTLAPIPADTTLWDPDTPLLAPRPIKRIPADERAMRISGRFYILYNQTIDLEDSNRYYQGRVGNELRAENPFGAGGTFRYRTEVALRARQLERGDDDSDFEFRFRRLSYAWKSPRKGPWHVEVGRFAQTTLSELGTIDGGELSYQLSERHRVGFSAGFLPEPYPDMQTGEDLQLAFFYRFDLNRRRDLSLSLGFQKTFHKGREDRDLFLVKVEAIPNQHFSLHGTLWADLYGSEDRIKSRGLELSRAVLRSTFRLDADHGLTLRLSYRRWPELRRDGFNPALAEQVDDSEVLTVGADTWQGVGKHVILEAGADWWKDDEDSGFTFRGGFTLRELWRGNRISLSLGTIDGRYQEGFTFLASVSQQLGPVHCRLGYDGRLFDVDNGEDDQLLHALFANLDWAIMSDLSVSTSARYSFGDDAGGVDLSLYLQKTF